MSTKVLILLFLLTVTGLEIYAGDSIHYELLQLEKIRVDTIEKIDANKYIGHVTVSFKTKGDTLIEFSYINVMNKLNSNVTYSWADRYFTLSLGMYYKLLMVRVCKYHLEKESFYAKYSDLVEEGCNIQRLFNASKYDYDFSTRNFHLADNGTQLYRVIRFHPTFISELKDSGYKLDFLPIKLGK